MARLSTEAKNVLRQLADMGVTPEQARREIQRYRDCSLDGTSGQDRDNYSDTQDRSNYS